MIGIMDTHHSSVKPIDACERLNPGSRFCDDLRARINDQIVVDPDGTVNALKTAVGMSQTTDTMEGGAAEIITRATPGQSSKVANGELGNISRRQPTASSCRRYQPLAVISLKWARRKL